jgi:hypothetical protein
MTNTDLAQVIPPSEPDLLTLAKQINAEYDGLKQALMSSCQRAIALGKLLLRAKELVKAQGGSWIEWQADNTNVDLRKAQRCMELASRETELIAITPDLSRLSQSDAIGLLADLRDPGDKSLLTRSSTTTKARQSPVDSAIKKDPLAVLKKAWAETNDGEKDKFRQHIG